jgi:hypothetical protein
MPIFSLSFALSQNRASADAQGTNRNTDDNAWVRHSAALPFWLLRSLAIASRKEWCCSSGLILTRQRFHCRKIKPWNESKKWSMKWIKKMIHEKNHRSLFLIVNYERCLIKCPSNEPWNVLESQATVTSILVGKANSEAISMSILISLLVLATAENLKKTSSISRANSVNLLNLFELWGKTSKGAHGRLIDGHEVGATEFPQQPECIAPCYHDGFGRLVCSNLITSIVNGLCKQLWDRKHT